MLVAGVDEAGRGPLAGPVVAAAVILHPERRIGGLRDSKLLTPPVREKLAVVIRARAFAWNARMRSTEIRLRTQARNTAPIVRTETDPESPRTDRVAGLFTDPPDA